MCVFSSSGGKSVVKASIGVSVFFFLLKTLACVVRNASYRYMCNVLSY